MADHAAKKEEEEVIQLNKIHKDLVELKASSERTAAATERLAIAAERSADAQERSARAMGNVEKLIERFVEAQMNF